MQNAVRFFAHLPPGYVAFFTRPLGPRTLALCLVALAAAALWKQAPPAWRLVLIIAAAQLADVGMFVVHDPVYAPSAILPSGACGGGSTGGTAGSRR